MITMNILLIADTQEKKVFSVQGPYPVIRNALRARGWVERRLPRPTFPQLRRHGELETEAYEADSSDGDGESNWKDRTETIYITT